MPQLCLPPSFPLFLFLEKGVVFSNYNGFCKNCMIRFRGPDDDKYLILTDTKVKKVRDPYVGPNCAVVCILIPRSLN